MLRFFFQRQNALVRCEFDDTIRGRIGDIIAEYCRAVLAIAGAKKMSFEVLAGKKSVVSDRMRADGALREKRVDNQGLGKQLSGLCPARVFEAESKSRAIAEVTAGGAVDRRASR